MKYLARIYRSLGLPGRAIFFATALIYMLLFANRTLLDITAQVQTLVKVCAGEVAMPPIFLFYGLTWLAAFGQCDFVPLMGAAIVILTAFVTAKWWTTRHIFQDYFSDKNPDNERFGWVAVALTFVCSLPTLDFWRRGWYIIGQPSPNYWMNGTVLVSWPFALMLFWESYRQLQRPQPGWWRRMLMWLVLLAISKPSYAFVFALVFPIFWLGRHGFGKRLWLQMLGLLLFALVLVGEYYLVFQQSDSVYVRDFNRGDASGVAVQPFHVWGLWSSNIPLSVVASVAFPLFVVAAFWQDLREKLLFWYAWAGFFAAICIYALLVQTGEEHYTGAFRFQNYIAAHALFIVSVLFVWEKIRDGALRLNGRVKWAIAIFLLHLLSGLIYLGKMAWTRSHY